MASSQPIIKQVSWISLIPQFLFLILLYFIFKLLHSGDPLFFSLIVYLVLSLTLRQLIPFHHRSGVRLFKKLKYAEAIKELEQSYTFFKKHSWIDRYRAIILLSSSRISYTEMALVNIAFCYGQIGNGIKSKEYYEKTIKEFPGSKIAIAALNMYNAANKTTDENI